MTQPVYDTVFAIGVHSFPWGAIWFFALPIVVGLALVRFARGKQIRKVVGAGLIVFSLFAFLLVSMSSVSQFMMERRAYASGQFSVVEGKIENFRPMPPLGRADESFFVNGVMFSYNVLDDTACFHNAHPHGIIRPGVEVRVFYKDGCILRLDIRRKEPMLKTEGSNTGRLRVLGNQRSH